MRPSLDQIETASAELAKADAALARAFILHGAPEWRARDHGYETLARTIVYQQISTSAAATIWGRFEAHLNGDICPDRVLGSAEDDLRGCGLSRPKIRHLSSIAEAVADGRLNFDRLSGSDDDSARAELISVKGIGPWTADIYLMSSLGRMDAFPDADIALIEAYRMLRADDERLTPKAFRLRAEAWRPYRAVAALMLWTHINTDRELARGGAG